MGLSVEERKTRMRARRGLQRRIARKLGMSEAHICLVVAGKSKSRKVQREIARHLNMAVAEAFPETVA